MTCTDLLEGLRLTGTGKTKLQQIAVYVKAEKLNKDPDLLIEDMEKEPRFPEGTLAKMRAILALTPAKFKEFRESHAAAEKPKEFLAQCGLDRDSIRAAMVAPRPGKRRSRTPTEAVGIQTIYTGKPEGEASKEPAKGDKK